MIIGSKKIFLKKLTSTNSYLSQLLLTELMTEGTIIQAGFQTAGRGQKYNKWESEDSKNLIFSILLYPCFIPPAKQFLISMAISMGISDFLSRHTDRCRIKWPNDIYVNNDKIAGILIENSLMDNEIKSSVAGIGFNINQVDFMSDAPNPVSLKMITGCEHDLKLTLDQLLSDLDKRYKQLLKGEFLKIRNEYNLNLFRLSEWCQYSDGKKEFTGRIKSAGEDGRLLIENSDGTVNGYLFKEVDFIH